MPDVLCLRPRDDFTRIGVIPPESLSITYMSPDDPGMPATLKAADALVIPAVGPKLQLALFDQSRVKLVQVTGAGVDRVDVAGLKGLGVAVANVPGGSNEAIAEYAISCALTLLRRFPQSTAAIRNGDYAAFRGRLLADNVEGLGGLLVGIIGMGVIGSAVAKRFKDCGASIAYYDPAPGEPAAARDLDAQSLGLEELLARCDVVSLHVPLMASTQDLLDTEDLARMKPGAVLVQASRGGVVNEAALAAALEGGPLGGAAVDVYSSEPPGIDNPLLRLSEAAAQRTILTPHIAGITRQSWEGLFVTAWDNVVRVLVENKEARHAV